MTVNGATVAVTTSIAGIAGNAGAFKRAVSSVRRAALVLLLGAALPAAAQIAKTEAQAVAPAAPTAAAAPAAISTPAPLADAELLRALRHGGLVVYFRHTATDFTRDDSKMRDFDDCANQRLLSPRGRADARAIGAQWKRLAIRADAVLASPYCRTRDVAQLMFGRHERSNEVRGGPISGDADRYAGLKRLLSTPRPAGANLVISSHGNPWQAVAGAPYLSEGEAAVVRPQGEGRWELVARLRVEDWERLK